MSTKHEQILSFIESLPIGDKLSVRLIAKELNVSEGTAYRAIKEAENIGLVTTIQRVGTTRIENKSEANIENLTFEEILKIIDGELLGGESGLNKTLNKFIIGAMEEDAMLRYITEESLMIIGNREDAQKLSLENGAAVLITGGFRADQDIITLSDELALPVMTTSYDTFTVGSMINRAMTDQLIKKEIMLIDSIYTRLDQTDYLTVEDTIYDYRIVNQNSQHTRFPVVGLNNRLVGIVTAKDIIGKEDSMLIKRVMTREPAYTTTHMSVASISHTMIWDGLEVMPVVSDEMKLLGIVSRQDIMKAMQSQQRQPQTGETIADQINQLIKEISDEEFTFNVTPQMTNGMGTISFGVLSEIINETAYLMLSKKNKRNLVVEQIQLHYLNLIQIGSQLTIKPRIFDKSRRSARLDIEVYSENGLAAKAIVVCQLLQKH
ncbi:DRTGG domain-containing protein [Marinilactibacillus psychrotolerans]|uniref:CBS domain-containing protein n=1 Tax=Marinilactibacillus psychrotolerans TaxID=191770 RepID=A0A5R9C3M9_9LACT|nr:DRTGG domain-containing protein [Marinilactibacillus psychrotolerans]TLQ07382.1 CBS domain-containing protein [Marinilactibacillus psychrotolerans]